MRSDRPSAAAGPPSERSRLVAQCRRGDQDAWQRMVERHQNLVYSIILKSRVGDQEEADVFQAVWIDIYRQLDRLRDPEALPSWIATITRHKCYHWGRAAIRRPLRAWDAKIEAHLLDPAPSPEEWLEDLLRRQQIRDAIETLSPRCRQLLVALFLTDPPRMYAEVADQLGIPVGSISTLRIGCLHKLKRTIRSNGLG